MNRVPILIFTGLGALISAAGAGSVLAQDRPPSFTPYLVFLLGVPFFALAAGLATGGVVFARPGEARPAPEKRADGWWEVPVFRRWLALRNAAAATWAILAAAGFLAFVDFFAKATEPDLRALLALVVWMGLLARLAWAVLTRTVVARGLEEARLFLRPRGPVAGQPLAVRVEQAAPPSARRGTPVRALEATLVCEETTRRPRRGKSRSETRTVHRERLVLGQDLLARPGAPARAEGTWTLPGTVGRSEGWLRWRVDVRTRKSGPDYATRFPIATVDDESES